MNACLLRRRLPRGGSAERPPNIGDGVRAPRVRTLRALRGVSVQATGQNVNKYISLSPGARRSIMLMKHTTIQQAPGRSGPRLGCCRDEHNRCSATAQSSTMSGVARVRTTCRPCTAGCGRLGHLWSGICEMGQDNMPASTCIARSQPRAANSAALHSRSREVNI